MLESIVKSYCRSFPDQMTYANGAEMFSKSGKRYIDFLSACGALNYGHNDNTIKDALIDYLMSNGVVMAMDMNTATKERFLTSFYEKILKPRNLDYRVQFTGPTGTNAVEAAIKLARKVTGRPHIISFTNAFHGVTLGSLALTGNHAHRGASEAMLHHVIRHPYDRYYDDSFDSMDYLNTLLEDPSSGISAPAAFIAELVQGEGGLNVARRKWLTNLSQIAHKYGSLLIIDDIQAGCGRTSAFFSFETCDISPDIIVLAKSISGYGLPLSLVLLKPEYDVWHAGEHNGTFRANNLALIAAISALETYWSDDNLSNSVKAKTIILRDHINRIATKHGFAPKGIGFMQGIDVYNQQLSKQIREECFKKGLIVEACGPTDNVIKLLPPLTISNGLLEEGMTILASSFDQAIEAAVAGEDVPLDSTTAMEDTPS